MKTLDELRNRISFISNDALVGATIEALNEPNFGSAPASLGFHHAYEGGLAIHTLEVLNYAQHLADEFPSVNLDVLITACVWHDVAKVREYEMQWIDQPVHHTLATGRSIRPQQRGFVQVEQIFTWGRASDNYGKLIHHIQGSHAMFYAAAVKHGVPQHLIDAVSHCILAHHGPVREWGSPVAPQTLEATLLHQADMLSAKFGATKDAP